MRIVLVLTYPIYCSHDDPHAWLAWHNRDRRMAGLLAAMGADVELWGVAHAPMTVSSDVVGLPSYPIRLFAPDSERGRVRTHRSGALVAHARADPANLYVLVGSDGGVGLHLHDAVLRPAHARFAVILGGQVWSRILPHAALVLSESAVQEQRLLQPRQPWRRALRPEQLLRLPKSIDTDRFAPREAAPRTDLLAIARLDPSKSFAEIGALSNDVAVAVAGGGPLADKLHRRYPTIDWLGAVPNADIPMLLAGARLFFHAGRTEYFPRAIVEAMACGVPVVAYGDWIGEDVVPADCGIRVDERTCRAEIAALLADEPRRRAMGLAARARAVAMYGPDSTRDACATLMRIATA